MGSVRGDGTIPLAKEKERCCRDLSTRHIYEESNSFM